MPIVPPVISTFTAGVLILLQMALMLSVVVGRRRARQSLGDGDDERLLRAIRRHGNLAENAALFLVAFALLEMMGGRRPLLAGLATAFVVARLAHVVGLSMKRSVNAVRVGGVAVTAIVGFVLGSRLLAVAAARLFP